MSWAYPSRAAPLRGQRNTKQTANEAKKFSKEARLLTEALGLWEHSKGHCVGKRKEEPKQQMAFIDSSRRGTIAVLIAALVIVAVGTTIWLMTDNNTGTNSLATDEKAMTRTPRLP